MLFVSVLCELGNRLLSVTLFRQSSGDGHWAQSLQWEVDAVSSLSARLFSSLCPVSAFVSVLSEFCGRLISISCALSLSLVRLKIGAQSSLMLLFCQFAISLVFMSFIYFLILCFRVVCGIRFFAVGIIGSSDLEPAFARISAISFPS